MSHRIEVRPKARVFLGYGLSGPFDLDLALQKADLAGAAQGEKFAVLPQDRARSIREKFPNVQVIPYSRHEDVPAIIAQLIRESQRPSAPI